MICKHRIIGSYTPSTSFGHKIHSQFTQRRWQTFPQVHHPSAIPKRMIRADQPARSLLPNQLFDLEIQAFPVGGERTHLRVRHLHMGGMHRIRLQSLKALQG